MQATPNEAATSIFRSTVYLLHGLAPKPIPSNMPPDFVIKDVLTGNDLSVSEQKAAVLKINTPSMARPNRTCYARVNDQFDQVLSIYSTQELLAEIGLFSTPHPMVADAITNLRRGILYRWYGNDHKPLLLLQQQSKADQIMEEIGRFRRKDSNMPQGSRGELLGEGLNYTDTLLQTGEMT